MNIKMVCINGILRSDRWQESMDEFEKADLEVERFDAIMNKENPHYGCALSHLRCLEMCEKKGYDAVLVFEDDVSIDKPAEFKELLSTSLKELPPDFDILYLGGYIYNNCKLWPYSQHLIQVEHMCQTHALLYNIKFLGVFQEMMSGYTKDNTYDSFSTFDDWLAHKIQIFGKCFIIKDFPTVQRESFSDTKHNIITGNPRWAKLRFILFLKGFGWFARLISFTHLKRLILMFYK